MISYEVNGNNPKSEIEPLEVTHEVGLTELTLFAAGVEGVSFMEIPIEAGTDVQPATICVTFIV